MNQCRAQSINSFPARRNSSGQIAAPKESSKGSSAARWQPSTCRDAKDGCPKLDNEGEASCALRRRGKDHSEHRRPSAPFNASESLDASEGSSKKGRG
mmetsp:Transcript_72935/g.128819  ORF Transcript_72935/g.128819 Transcript_72935/m.128819 type:complete len:98 (+) Transcript_72935:95-388(+)